MSMKHGTLKKISASVNISSPRMSNILSGNVPCGRRLAIRLNAVTGIDRAIWVFEPERLRALLAEKYPKEQKS